jgi:hypothetical protein
MFHAVVVLSFTRALYSALTNSTYIRCYVTPNYLIPKPGSRSSHILTWFDPQLTFGALTALAVRDDILTPVVSINTRAVGAAHAGE